MKLPLFYFTAALVGLSQWASAQALDPTFATPTALYKPGEVRRLVPQQADGKRLVFGYFSRVNGTATGSLVRLDANGVLDQAFTQQLGTVRGVQDVLALPTGQYLLSAEGDSLAAGGLARAELLRLNATGSADATFNAGTGPAAATGRGFSNACAAQADGKILVAGRFDSFSGTAAAGVVRLLPTGGIDPTFSVGAGLSSSAWSAGASIKTMVVQADGKILVGGKFTSFNGQAASGVVRLTAAGSLDPTFSPALQASTTVDELLVQPDGRILVGGYVQFTGSTATTGLARLLPTGAADTGFSATGYLNNSFAELQGKPALQLQPDGKILVAGYPAPATSGTYAVARLTTTGSTDATFTLTNTPEQIPTTIGLQADGSILAGGSFRYFNQVATPLGRFTSTGAVDASFVPKLQLPGVISTVTSLASGQLLVGGNFSEFNGQPAYYLARLSAAGVLDAGFSAAAGQLPEPVARILVQPDTKILVGAGIRVLRFLPSGSPDPAFTTYKTGGIRALALQADGRILVGAGVISSTYANLLRLTSAGAFDPTFVRPSTNSEGLGIPGDVNDVLVQPDGKIVVAEEFFNSTPPFAFYSRVIRCGSTGTLDASFANASAFGAVSASLPNDHAVLALAQQPDGKLLVGGYFGSVNGTAQAGVARLTTTGTLDASFTPGTGLSGYVTSLALQPNGRVLLGGSFTTGARTNLARVLADGQLDASFANTATPNNTVTSLALSPAGGIALAGYFTTIGGQAALSVARLTAPNVLAVAAPAAIAARISAWPVPAHDRLHVAPDPSAQPQLAELLDALGRPVVQQALAGGVEFTLPTAGLPAGFYLLRLTYATGTVTRQVVVE